MFSHQFDSDLFPLRQHQFKRVQYIKYSSEFDGNLRQRNERKKSIIIEILNLREAFVRKILDVVIDELQRIQLQPLKRFIINTL